MRGRVARFTAAFQALLLMATLVLPALAAATEISTDLWIYQYGDTVTVTGIDFGADEDVSVVTTDPYGAGVDSGTAHTDSAGAFTYAFVLASDVPGIYDVVATGLSSGLSAATQFDPPATIVITFPTATVFTNATFDAGCATAGGDLCGTAITGAGNLTKIEYSLQEGGGNYWNGSSFGSASLAKITLFSGSTTTITSWSITPFPATNFPTDGPYTLTIYTTQSGSPSAGVATRAFALDRTAAGAPPKPVLTGSTPGSPSTNNSPSISGTAENGTTVKLYKQNDCGGGLQGTGYANGSFSIPVSVGANSSTDFYATATDASGNVSPCSTTFVHYVADSSAPSVALNSTPTNPTTSTAANFAFTATDTGASASGVASVQCRLDSPTWGACDTNTSFGGTVGVGNHTFAVRATDWAGNVGGETTYSWTVSPSDAIKPVITATATANGNPYVSGTWTKYNVSVSFTCADNAGGSGIATDTVAADNATISSEGAGQFVASDGDCIDNAGNVADGVSFTGINIDKTAPVITGSATPAANANGWNNADVVVSFDCDDEVGGSGIATDTVAGETLADEGAGQSATSTGDCIDAAGNTATAVTVSDINIDKTAPVITGDASPDANTNGWNNTDVVVSFVCADPNGTDPSGIDIDTVAGETLTTEGADQSATSTGDCTDKAGNAAVAATVSGINIDKTAPVITGSASPAANGNGWNNTDVVVSFSCADEVGGSGIDIDTVAGATLSSEGAGQSVTNTGDCSDLAENVASSATVTGINIDKSAPVVTLAAGGVQDGGIYYFGFVPAGPSTCTADGSISGLTAAGCTVSGYSNAIGTHTVTGSATDLADNTGTDSRTYEVRAWTVNGFYSPVDMGGVINTVKAGSTVPLKFEIFAGATELTSTSYITGFKATEVGCFAFSLLSADDIEITSTGGTTLRYDSTGGQYIQNWATAKNKAGVCYVVTMTANDGTSLNAFFKLK